MCESPEKPPKHQKLGHNQNTIICFIVCVSEALDIPIPSQRAMEKNCIFAFY